MAMSPVPMAGSMDLNGTYIFSVVADSTRESSNPSSWTYIEYDLRHKRYRVLNSGNTIVQEGEYELGEHFGIPEMGLQGNLSSFEASCGLDPTVSIANAEGKVMIKTVQFTICGELQALSSMAMCQAMFDNASIHTYIPPLVNQTLPGLPLLFSNFLFRLDK
ncbi:hypothetical protein DFP73DRAFT_524338 [Morchella snyderi]|nr:hypothetical protein DFP73DRAFT_524338 [Morchella snyderi]